MAPFELLSQWNQLRRVSLRKGEARLVAAFFTASALALSACSPPPHSEAPPVSRPVASKEAHASSEGSAESETGKGGAALGASREAEDSSTSAATSSGSPSPAAPEHASSEAPESGKGEAPGASETPAAGEPLLLAQDGRPLPQTQDKPTVESPRFQEQVRLLFDAIVRDEASLAAGFFFPQLAYEQVKDIPDPSADFKARLFSAYEKDIHAYHKALGKFRDEATFEEMRVAEQLARWVSPGEEVNKEGYYRVMRSVLVYRDHQGRKRELLVRTMISWRGEWYVVHLK